MVNVMRVDHPLQVSAPFGGAPFDPLVNDNVVENKVENSIAQDSEAHSQHIWVVAH